MLYHECLSASQYGWQNVCFPLKAGTTPLRVVIPVNISQWKLWMPSRSVIETDSNVMFFRISHILATPAPLHFVAGPLLACTMLYDIDMKFAWPWYFVSCDYSILEAARYVVFQWAAASLLISDARYSPRNVNKTRIPFWSLYCWPLFFAGSIFCGVSQLSYKYRYLRRK